LKNPTDASKRKKTYKQRGCNNDFEATVSCNRLIKKGRKVSGNIIAAYGSMSNSAGIDGIVDRDNIFLNHKGIYKKAIEKRQRKLLEPLAFLKDYLDEGEKILLVTTAVSPTSVMEQMITGWIFMYMKRCLLVFTDRRIFHIPTTQKYQYRNSIAHVRYADCKKMKMGWGKLNIVYGNKKKEMFIYIGSQERARIKNLVNGLSLGDNTDAGTGRAHLCPRCTSKLEKHQYKCNHCRLEFKSKAEARKLAILIPGGGYFYTRHPVLGFFDALVEIFLIAMLIFAIGDVIDQAEGAVAGLIVIAIILTLEKLISVYHSNHYVEEYLTVDGKGVYPDSLHMAK
jgi:hypothetical protein